MNQLLDVAIVAYRAGRYRDTIDLLVPLVEDQPWNWIAGLYLGMAYQRNGQHNDSYRVLKQLAGECPDPDMKDRVRNAMLQVETEMHRKYLNKAARRKKATVDPDNPDVVWLSSAQ